MRSKSRRSLTVVLVAAAALMFAQVGMSAAVGAEEVPPGTEAEARGAPGPEDQVPEAPDPEAPAPEEPAPEAPAPEAPAPEAPAPEEPAPDAPEDRADPAPASEADVPPPVEGEEPAPEAERCPEVRSGLTAQGEPDVCPIHDGKYEIGTGWEGDPAPGIVDISGNEGQVTFTVEAGYTLVSMCVKTGNGVNQDDWSVSPPLPVVGPAQVTVTSSGGQGAGLSHITFDTEVVVPEDSYALNVLKLWDPIDGPPGQTLPTLPAGFQIILSGQGPNGGSVTCTYTGNTFECTGTLELTNGEKVTVVEINMPPGWDGPDDATASCTTTPNQTGGTDTVCTISLTNVQQPEQPVNGGQEPEVKPQADEKPKAEVLAEEVRPEAELAFTGVELAPMVLMVIGLTLLGIAFVSEGRRRAR